MSRYCTGPNQERSFALLTSKTVNSTPPLTSAAALQASADWSLAAPPGLGLTGAADDPWRKRLWLQPFAARAMVAEHASGAYFCVPRRRRRLCIPASRGSDRSGGRSRWERLWRHKPSALPDRMAGDSGGARTHACATPVPCFSNGSQGGLWGVSLRHAGVKCTTSYPYMQRSAPVGRTRRTPALLILTE